MDRMPSAVTLITDNSDKIDVDRFRNRVQDMTKAFMDFTANEIDGIEGAVNLEMPLTLAMALTHINSIPLRLGINGASDDFVKVVKNSILEAVSEDFDICLDMARQDVLDG